MGILLEATTKREQKMAQSSVERLQETSQKVIHKNTRTVNIKFHEKGEYISIPKRAFALLVDVLNNMAAGKSIALLPADTLVSTQQAAYILNVSRPYIVALLEEGKIPFQKAGTHRRIRAEDIFAYRDEMKERQKKGLAILTKQAQELNLGYE